MQVKIKLFATLRIDRFKEELRDINDGAEVAAIVRNLGIQEKELGAVLVNGRRVELKRVLVEGDVLAIFPLIGGG